MCVCVCVYVCVCDSVYVCVIKDSEIEVVRSYKDNMPCEGPNMVPLLSCLSAEAIDGHKYHSMSRERKESGCVSVWVCLFLEAKMFRR